MVQFQTQFFGQGPSFGCGAESHGQHHNVKSLFHAKALFINIADHVHAGLFIRNNIRYPRLYKPNARLILGPVVVSLKVFPVGADIHVKDGRIQAARGVFLGQHGLFNGIGTANARAIPSAFQMFIPRTYALQPGNLFRFFFVRRAYHVPAVGTGSGQDALKFEAGHHVLVFAVPIGVVVQGIVGFAAGGHDYRTHVQINIPFFVLIVNGACGTDFFTVSAFSLG